MFVYVLRVDSIMDLISSKLTNKEVRRLIAYFLYNEFYKEIDNFKDIDIGSVVYSNMLDIDRCIITDVLWDHYSYLHPIDVEVTDVVVNRGMILVKYDKRIIK